ncbi:ABC transporter permease subunit [Acidianus sulfidivorans JP7]|uniref:ABC transporter permease n=1 Tax=Acidianus sulfidivorans JP7 TaxID=619593 RepID=A0A2U9ILJ6_9CREN|nr:ABC transporter permease [Acidianus sulfidivorans]AWR96891.1 ABC transporter permease subunit [Acidianus sulfidivorans JP7]
MAEQEELKSREKSVGRSGALKYIAGRLISRVILLIAVINFNFFLFEIIPAIFGINIASFYVPPGFTKSTLSRSTVLEGVEKQFGLNKPLDIRYIDYLRDIVTFNFGDSFHYEEPVTKLILQRLPVTAEIVIPSLIITTIMAIVFGVYSSTRQGKVVDHIISNTAIVTYFIPAFWLGFIMWYFLTIQFNLFPSSYTLALLEPGNKTINLLLLLIPPIITLSITTFGVRNILMRNNSIDTLQQDFVTILEAKGLSKSKIMYKHVFRNAFLPVFTRVGIDFAFLLSGIVFIEDVFNIPGLGRLLITAATHFDIPLLLGDFFTISLFAIIVLTLMDFLYVLVDPRVKYQ